MVHSERREAPRVGIIVGADGSEAKLPLLGVEPRLRAAWALKDAGVEVMSTDGEAGFLENRGISVGRRTGLCFVVRADALIASALLNELGPDEAIADREGRMWDAQARAEAADDVIDNSGSAAELQERVDAYIARYAGR